METPPKVKQKASFARLLKDLMTSLGVKYLTPEHIRLSKSSEAAVNPSHQPLVGLLWRALHDLCMIIIGNFEFDCTALAKESQVLSEEPNGLEVCVEVARYYLYDLGFLSKDFYTMPNPLDISGPIMLCALAFVLTHGDFFSRQELAIIRLQLSDSTVCLPPYPKVPVIQPEHKENALKDTVETFQDTIAYQVEVRPQIAQSVHHIHAAYGKLQAKLKELRALEASHTRLLQRIHDVQLQQLGSTTLMEKSTIDDSILSPYYLWLFEHREKLKLHQQALEQRLTNYSDEKLFYQWVLATICKTQQTSPRYFLPLVSKSVTVTSSDLGSTMHESSNFTSLLTMATKANESFQAAPSRELYRLASKQWKDITSGEKTRAKGKLEAAMAKMQDELPSLEVLYKPIARSPRIAEATPRSSEKDLPRIDKAMIEQDIQRLVVSMEQRFGVRLV
ncbi:hypothetical protein AeMF1_017290 [Aphanomyces euteiches]|nr:hypothetical protein AeMF1_017290 [Aphanomyces euteiches]KAH9197440.1 hypothetical protein AeNC1_000599 [Aphanomyces euteiches]